MKISYFLLLMFLLSACSDRYTSSSLTDSGIFWNEDKAREELVAKQELVDSKLAEYHLHLSLLNKDMDKLSLAQKNVANTKAEIKRIQNEINIISAELIDIDTFYIDKSHQVRALERQVKDMNVKLNEYDKPIEVRRKLDQTVIDTL